MITQVEIKEKILNNLKFFNYGFANLFLDYAAKKIISYENNHSLEFGIDDRYGNYFYLRNDGDIQFSTSPEIIEHIQNLELKKNTVLVAMVSDANPNKLLKCLLNAIAVNNEIQINKAFFTNERVVTSEFSFLNKEEQKHILSRLTGKSLIKISFTVFENFQPNDRDCVTCNPCINCNEM